VFDLDEVVRGIRESKGTSSNLLIDTSITHALALVGLKWRQFPSPFARSSSCGNTGLLTLVLSFRAMSGMRGDLCQPLIEMRKSSSWRTSSNN
jgi:hypothetical protein